MPLIARKQLTLGQLIDLLDKVQLRSAPQFTPVRFDFCGVVPAGYTSYRGFYEDLAITWTEHPLHEVTLASFRAQLKQSLGTFMEGYKGGTYHIDRETATWVANPGHTSGTYISDVKVVDDRQLVILKTRWTST